MTAHHRVGRLADFPEGSHLVVDAGGREIGIFNVRGRLYALPNVCLHQSGPLCRGRTSGTLAASAETGWKRVWIKEGEIIICPWHGLEFEIVTGRCLAFPSRRLPVYAVRVEGDGVFVSLGRAADQRREEAR